MFRTPTAFALPTHNYSSSQGSEFVTFGASASGDAFVRAGLPINSLATNNEPYLPRRQHNPPTGNPSPLNYSVAPEFVPAQTDNLTDYISDGPYIPPNFHHPPPLTVQNRYHQYRTQLPRSVPYPLLAPQVQRDLPESPLSSSSDSSIMLSLAHPAPSQDDRESDIASPHMSDSIQVPLPGDDHLREDSRSAGDSSDSDSSVHSEHWVKTDKYLRTQIGIPEGTRVDLSALPDPPPGQKPQQPLPILVKLAIHGCSRGMLTLQEIYQALEDRFEYFSLLKNTAWKNSIRHNLSLNQVFRSCDRPITEPGKGRYWSLDISKGEGYKRERRRKRRNAAPYNGTRDLPGGIGNRPNPAHSSDPDEIGGGPSVVGRVASVKTSRRGRKRGPYTKITVGRPSVPGSTGITAGGVAAVTFVPYRPCSSNSSASGTTSPASHVRVPAASSSAGTIGSGSKNYRFRTTFAGTSHAAGSAPATTRPSVSSVSSLQQENWQMRGVQSTVPATLPYSFPSSYRGMYFNRATEPKFGEISLGAPSTFVPQTRVGFLNPVGGTIRRGRTESVTSVSSDGMSSPEMGERRLRVVAGGRTSGCDE